MYTIITYIIINYIIIQLHRHCLFMLSFDSKFPGNLQFDPYRSISGLIKLGEER